MNKRLPGELLITVCFLVISALAFLGSFSIKGGSIASAAMFPRLMSGLMFLMACHLLHTNLRSGRGGGTGDGGDSAAPQKRMLDYLFTKDVVFMLCLIPVYCVLLGFIGFVADTFLFLFATFCFYQKGSVIRNAVIAAGIVGIVYLLFEMVFKVILP